MPDADRKALADMLSSVNRWYERTPASAGSGRFPGGAARADHALRRCASRR